MRNIILRPLQVEVLLYKFQFHKEAIIGLNKRARKSMATLPLGHLISPLTKELSRQDRNTVHIGEGINNFPLEILRNITNYKIIYLWLQFFLCVYLLAAY